MAEPKIETDLKTNTVKVDGEGIGQFFISSYDIALIDKWFVEEFHGHPAMASTEAFNHVRAAVDRLKKRLQEENPK